MCPDVLLTSVLCLIVLCWLLIELVLRWALGASQVSDYQDKAKASQSTPNSIGSAVEKVASVVTGSDEQPKLPEAAPAAASAIGESPIQPDYTTSYMNPSIAK